METEGGDDIQHTVKKKSLQVSAVERCLLLQSIVFSCLLENTQIQFLA